MTTFVASLDNSYAASGFAIGPKIGLEGFGVEGRANIADNLYGRLGVNYFGYTPKLKSSTLNYKVTLTMLTVPLMLDYHPIDGSGFRVSAGVAYNGTKVTGKSTPAQNVTLYGNTYTPDQIGTVKSTLEFKSKIAPILSIGYDSSLLDDSPWSFNAEAGFMYAGKAKIKVSASGLLGQQTQTINDVNKDVNKNLDSINKYLKFLPVVSIGIKFNI